MAKHKHGINKVRKQVGKPTMEHTPKTIYDRNDWKKETQEIIEEECTCIRMNCICEKKEKE